MVTCCGVSNSLLSKNTPHMTERQLPSLNSLFYHSCVPLLPVPLGCLACASGIAQRRRSARTPRRAKPPATVVSPKPSAAAAAVTHEQTLAAAATARMPLTTRKRYTKKGAQSLDSIGGTAGSHDAECQKVACPCPTNVNRGPRLAALRARFVADHAKTVAPADTNSAS